MNYHNIRQKGDCPGADRRTVGEDAKMSTSNGTGPMHVISLGAGVQSSTMLMMAELGQIEPRPDAAIFADTQWEPPQVYQHLDWLEANTTIPIHRTTASNLYQDVWDGRLIDGHIITSIPVYAATEKGARLSRRQCTSDYKIRPIRRAIRELLGKGPRSYIAPGTVVQWIGISTDEWMRMRDSDVAYQVHRWPLIELDMTRQDCVAWWREHYPCQPLVKSACIGCPFHSNRAWLDLLRTCPTEMERTMLLDERLRDPGRPVNPDTHRYDEYLHRSLRPLRDVLHTLDAADQAQLPLIPVDDVDGFGNECAGYCGV